MTMYVHAQAVDVHSHAIVPQHIEALAKHNALLDEGFPLPKWDVKNHVKMMDKQGIATSVISLPAPQPWWGDTDESKEVVRTTNLVYASLERHYPNRFRFVATLPLPDVAAAIQEARFAIDTLGAVGVKLASNAYGQYLGDATLEPLMAELNAYNAVVIIHPHKPSPVNDSIIKTAPLAIYEYPAETTRAVINMIANGVTSRYPNIRWVIPHCGSFLPLAIARMKGVHPIMQRAGLMKPIDWDTATDNLYYDLAGSLTPEVLQSLLAITTPDHLLYGSDYPYVNELGVKLNRANVEQILNENEQTKRHISNILTDNAKKLFGLQ